MPGPSDGTTPFLDRAARGAAAGMSRRQLVRLGAGAAVAATLPKVAWPTVAEAAKRRGSCPSPPMGSCPPGMSPGRWSRGAEVSIPSGKTSVFNGCGPESGVQLPVVGTVDPVPDRPLFVADFFDACKAHDCCYGVCGSDQDACDSAMYLDALRICQKTRYDDDANGVARHMQCNSVARLYYQAVAALGKDAWASAQETACYSCEPCEADLLSDPDNCGTCGNACGGTRVCCDGVCKDPEVDAQNCGACGNVCKDGQRCIGGQCVKRCKRGETPCDGTCCPPDKTCRDGQCVTAVKCPKGSRDCGGVCCDDKRPCIDDQCGFLCEGGAPCGAGQECCTASVGEPWYCCPKGTGCYFNIGGVGKCI
ncbi:MAG TPA: hypothetical protein VIL49_13175 [Capillimicrobium sp.]|jgi:hypothetical protein